MSRALVVSSVLLSLVVRVGDARAFEGFKEVNGNPLGAMSEWTNYIRLDDLDGDGDLDVFVPNCGGFFSAPSAQPFRIYKNDGKATFTESPEWLGGLFSSASRVVDLADVNGDGALELFVPSADGSADKLFVANGKGAWVDEAALRLGSHSHSAGARFFDADGDGDVDLLVAGGYATSEAVPARLYVNDGKGMFAEGKGKLPSQGPGDIDDVDAFDADGDFDLDLLVNSHAGKPALWMNDGFGSFVDASAKLGTEGAGYKYGPTACDVDGDGDRDLWIDNTGPGYTEALLINDGSGSFVDETSARVTGNPGADDNGVVCADVDLDGDFDAIVVSLSDHERVLLNDGTGHFTNVGGFPPIGDSTLWLDAGDLDGDGRLDAVTGQGESGNLRNRVYLGIADNPVDDRKPSVFFGPLPMTVEAGPTFEVRFRVADRVLVDAGPRVKAELRVAVDGAAPKVLPARFVGGDLFQAAFVGEAGSSIVIEACATDMHGNTGCSAKATLQGAGSAVAATASAGGGGDAGAGGATATASGAGGGTSQGGDTPATDGCSCRTGAALPKPWGYTGLLFALFVALMRRRRP